MGVEPTPETSCISSIPQAMDNIQHSFPVMNQPLSQTLQNHFLLLCLYEMLAMVRMLYEE
jgi:hypothetical protein